MGCHSCLSWKRCPLTSLKHPTTSKCPKMLNKTSKSLSARIFGPYLSFVKGTSSRLKKSNNSRDRTSCKKWKLKKFPWKNLCLKKYYRLKKLLRTLCSDEKFSKT